ncbi:curli-like amyloid fiber formation chaperone CsgH [Rhizobium oryzicola]|uniref:Curli-like amyloid fiber formation chaperone CsgH n=1 Tax=Rhizobium oryzicola TaxID=1232668 RepID=A0ABT8SQZ8_9HYPH|nr:curli-like amyloid fiber formation chaperone CsgH [Rhizobium oryzicola]MDO1580860.1 curli-like amyloid fiber formation chaperone CsgH [Rhizobium oryzicola]
MSPFAVSGNISIAAFALALAVLGGTAGVAATVAKKSPLSCEIRSSRQGGMVTLEGVVLSDTATNGTYSLKVQGSGRSGSNTIQQGGAFTTTAGRASTAGSVSLGSKGASYDVNFEARADGAKVTCSESIDG